MMRLVRTWLPAAIVTAGIVVAIVNHSETGLEGAAMIVGAGLAVWLLNLLYRLGVSGDRERDEEDRARDFYDQHGRWPDEDPPPAAPRPLPDAHRRGAARAPRRRP
jgi:hypothetical protein